MSLLNEHDVDLIAAILDQCDRIDNILTRVGKNKAVYDADEAFKDAIKMNLFQIGELTHQLSEEFKEKREEIPWHKIYGTRNIIAHGYLKVDDDIIWETCLSDIPFFRDMLERILDGED